MKKIIYIIFLLAVNLSAEENYLAPFDIILEYAKDGYLDSKEYNEVMDIYYKIQNKGGVKFYEVSSKSMSLVEQEIKLQVKGLTQTEFKLDLKNMNSIYKIYDENGNVYPDKELGKPRENHPKTKYNYPKEIIKFLNNAKAKRLINVILDELNYWLWYYSPMNPDAVLPETQNFMGSLSRDKVDAINYRVEVQDGLIYIFPDIATEGIDELYGKIKFFKKLGGDWSLNTLLNTTVYVVHADQIKDISIETLKSIGFGSYVKGAAFKIVVQFDKISTNLIERFQLAGSDWTKNYSKGDMVTPQNSLIQQLAKNTIALYYIGDETQYDEAADKIEKLFCMLICELQKIYDEEDFKWTEENAKLPEVIDQPRYYYRPENSIVANIDKNTKVDVNICNKFSKEGPVTKTPKPKPKPKPVVDTSKSDNWWDDFHKFVKWGGSFKNQILFLLLNTNINTYLSAQEKKFNFKRYVRKDKKTKQETINTECEKYEYNNHADADIPPLVNILFDIDEFAKVYLVDYPFDGKFFKLQAFKYLGKNNEGKINERLAYQYEGSFSNNYTSIEKLEITTYYINNKLKNRNTAKKIKVTLTNIPLAKIKYDKKKHFNIRPYWDLISNKNTSYYVNVDYFNYSEEIGDKYETYSFETAKNNNLPIMPPYLILTAQHNNFIVKAKTNEFDEIKKIVECCMEKYNNVESNCSNKTFPSENDYNPCFKHTGGDTTQSTSKDCPPTKLVMPENGQIDVAQSILLAWEEIPEATKYEVIVSKSANFNESDKVIDQITTATKLVINNLEPNTTYYWKVIVICDKNSLDNEVFKFTTLNTPIPENSDCPPTKLVMPKDGAVNVSTSPLLVWEAIPKAMNYRVQVSKSVTFVSKHKVIDEITTSTNFPVFNLEPNVKYYWKVTADCNKESLFNSVFDFTTEKKDDEKKKKYNCDTLFFDDFNYKSKLSRGEYDGTGVIDNSKLYIINGEWLTKEGRLISEAEKTGESLVLTGDIEWRQYWFTGDYRFENEETGNFGIIFYAQKEKINSTRYILLHSLIKQNVELWEIDGNDKAQLIREDKYNFKKNTIYNFDLQLINDEITYKVNGKNVLIWRETLELQKGRIGLRVAGKLKASFDNILVKKCSIK